MGINTNAIQGLYAAYFSRPADPAGLAWWEAKLPSTTAATEAQLVALANSGFSPSAEYLNQFAGMSSSGIVNTLYVNLFGRQAEAAGLLSWVAALDNGTQTVASIALRLMLSAQGTDATAITSKITAANAFTAALDTGTEIAGYSGTAAAASARSWLATVTDAASLSTAMSGVDAAVAAATSTNNQGDFVLTTGLDNLPGTMGADVFRAVAGLAVGSQDQTTLNSSDQINGSAGADTLIVNMTGATYAGGARIQNIETLQIGTNLTNAAATFDYNVNQGFNEVTDVTKIVADQINAGEALTVNNILKTNSVLPTLSWVNDSATQGAGAVTANYRAAQVSGSTDGQTVELANILGSVNNAAHGVLNIGAGIETLTVGSVSGSARNTLNNTTNVDTGVYAGAADLVSSGSLTKVVLQGGTELGKAADLITATGLMDRAAVGATPSTITDLGSTTGSTAANLLSVGSRVTEVDASTMTAASNVRFTPTATAGVGVNVTYKGGSANDYVEFELGNVNATGNGGDDTFAFIDTTLFNASFGSTDSITGGAGTDAIQLGLNGVGTFTLNTTEFANKTGVDVLDLRGLANTVNISDTFAAGADSGVLHVRTDRVVQTSTTNSANPTVNAAEDATVSVINITDLAATRGIQITGGTGSERIVGNNASLNAGTIINAGGNVGPGVGGTLAVAGDYDTVTIINSAVVDRGDLANLSGLEGFVLTKTTANAAFTFEMTEAFMLANTAATDVAAATTDIDERVFTIGTANAAGASALTAADTVSIEIGDLLNGNVLKTSLTGRGIDLSAIAATVTYTVNGLVANAAQIAAVTTAATTSIAAATHVTASVTGSAAQVQAPVGITYASGVGPQAILGTNLNDTFTLTQADTITAGTGADTVTFNAGSAAANVTLGATADTANVNVALTNAVNGLNMAAGGTVSIGADISGGAGYDMNTVGAAYVFGAATTVNVNTAQTQGAGTFTMEDGAGHTLASSVAGNFTLGIGGQTFSSTGVGAIVATGGTGADTFTIGSTGGATVTGANGIDTITVTADTGIDRIVVQGGTLAAGGVGVAEVGQAVNRDVVNGFSATNDIIALTAAATTAATAAAATPVVQSVAAAGATQLANTADVTIFNFDVGGSTSVLSGVLDGAALIANIGALTVGAVTNGGYILAYDNGNAYLYSYDADFAVVDVDVTAAEIALIGTFNGVATSALAVANFALI